MPSIYLCLRVLVVFSTHDRRAFIADERYLGSIHKPPAPLAGAHFLSLSPVRRAHPLTRVCHRLISVSLSG